MALKNTQYDEIMREYYRKQTEDRHEQEERIRRATEALPELTAIDHEIASLSVSSARKALEGDETALSHLREDIKALSEKKTELLTSHGYPRIILKCITTARTARTLAISVRRNATVSARPSSIFSSTQLQHPGHSGRGKFRSFFLRLLFRYGGEPHHRPFFPCHNEKTCGRIHGFHPEFRHGFPRIFFFIAVIRRGQDLSLPLHCPGASENGPFGDLFFLPLRSSTFWARNHLPARRNRGGDEEHARLAFSTATFSSSTISARSLPTPLSQPSFSSASMRALARRKSTIISTNLGLNVFRDTYSRESFPITTATK